jgi:hypothetical protein
MRSWHVTMAPGAREALRPLEAVDGLEALETMLPDDRKPEKEERERDEQAPRPSSVPLKPSGEVVLTYLDSPPNAGTHTIHPRRPAPIVPERAPGKADDDTDT